MFQQHRFDFRRRHGKSFVLDHLLAPVDHPVKTFAVARDNVARPIPSIAQHGRGRLRLFPISQHELRPAHHQLSRLAGRQPPRCRFSDVRQYPSAQSPGTPSAPEDAQSNPAGKVPAQDIPRASPAKLPSFHIPGRPESRQRRESSRQIRRQRRGSGLHPVHLVISSETVPPPAARHSAFIAGGTMRHHRDRLPRVSSE